MPYLSQFLHPIDIQFTPEEEESTSQDLSNASSNQGISKTSRTGTTSGKQSSWDLDLSNYDSQIADLQNQLSKYWGYTVGKNSYTNYGNGNIYAYRNWRDNVYNQIASLQAQRQSAIDNNATKTTLDKSTVAADQALKSSQISSQGEASANKQANINAGINKSAAGLLGSQSSTSSQASTANNVYSGNRASQVSTQADYLEKMAQANAADQMASNLNKSAGLAGLSGALSGTASGASMGAVISDSRMKESPDEEDFIPKLMEQVSKAESLYKQLKELRGE